MLEIHENKSNWSALSNAVVHFNSSYTRSYARDKLIDLSVSVEALFRDKSRIGGDISHRNSLRLARLIVKSNIERQEIYEKMKKLSLQRNRAVHASSQEQFDYQCLEEYVRQALKKYLELIKNNTSIIHEEIINSLDYD